jgi:hypothetical protein
MGNREGQSDEVFRGISGPGGGGCVEKVEKVGAGETVCAERVVRSWGKRCSKEVGNNHGGIDRSRRSERGYLGPKYYHHLPRTGQCDLP